MPQRELDGNILWHGFVHDVTERKRSEKTSAKAKRVFKRPVPTLSGGLPFA